MGLLRSRTTSISRRAQRDERERGKLREETGRREGVLPARQGRLPVRPLLRRERELLMVLLLDDAEVRTLPALVATWLRENHGSSPEARKGKQTSLFVVLTKFDKRFEKSKGGGRKSMSAGPAH